jgi:hypothetical protein
MFSHVLAFTSGPQGFHRPRPIRRILARRLDDVRNRTVRLAELPLRAALASTPLNADFKSATRVCESGLETRADLVDVDVHRNVEV